MGAATNSWPSRSELKPDCLLLDVHMPARSGLDVLEAIGGRPYPAPVIMISGQGDIPMAVAAIKAGAHDFIEKPFDADDGDRRWCARQCACTASAARTERARPTCWRPVSRRARRSRRASSKCSTRSPQGASNKEAGRMLGISPAHHRGPPGPHHGEARRPQHRRSRCASSSARTGRPERRAAPHRAPRAAARSPPSAALRSSRAAW